MPNIATQKTYLQFGKEVDFLCNSFLQIMLRLEVIHNWECGCFGVKVLGCKETKSGESDENEGFLTHLNEAHSFHVND